jgi:hypothetical protein
VVRGSLEHQVLEQVREPGAPRHLVLRSDVVPHVHGHDRAIVVFVDDDLEAVSEHMFPERDVELA